MNWLDELRRQVEMTSQGKVAAQLGVSKGTVSLLVNGKYPADTAAMQALVESVFMGQTVECPVMGEIPKHKCAAHQNATHVGSSPQAIRLWKACRSGCPNSELEERLSIPVRLTADTKTQEARPKRPDTEPNIRPYNPQATIARLERQARTDTEERMGGSYQQKLIELLKGEVIALGNRHNRLAKKQ